MSRSQQDKAKTDTAKKKSATQSRPDELEVCIGAIRDLESIVSSLMRDERRRTAFLASVLSRHMNDAVRVFANEFGETIRVAS